MAILFKGKVLYELGDSIIQYHNANYQAGKLESSVFVSELKIALVWLEESVKCLHMEREKTLEKTICQAARWLLNETIDSMVDMCSR